VAVWFASIRATRPERFADSWDELRANLAEHHERTDKQAGPLWSPVIYRDGARRSAAGVRAVWCLVADLDGEGLEHAHDTLAAVEWMAYTTWSHRPDDPHYHLVAPLADPVPAESWREVWATLHDNLGLVGDPATKDPSRIYFLPQHAPGAPFEVRRNTGRLLEVPDTVAGNAPRIRGRRRARTSERFDARKYLSEAWWQEPVDLSAYAGLSEAEAIVVMRRRWEELKAAHGWG
jgi:putative DNA primase/helicase